ncbi:hypothetical protein LCGC14_0372750 [marine sediment metagenome]|uniref:Uncharacterized protein n=1 Tax=marine sediment metagenome TaxID=412755 RepID=A0A0F9TAM9_9ZZZZ
MVEVQKGAKITPITIRPRIDGNIVTQTQIKNDFSNQFVDDITTPINFFMESKVRGQSLVDLAWDPALSTDSLIHFLPADAFYANEIKYTLLFFWTIANEKVYTKIPITLEVKDYHNEP